MKSINFLNYVFLWHTFTECWFTYFKLSFKRRKHQCIFQHFAPKSWSTRWSKNVWWRSIVCISKYYRLLLILPSTRHLGKWYTFQEKKLLNKFSGFSFLLTRTWCESDTSHFLSAKGCCFWCQFRFWTVQFVDWLITLIRFVIK